MFVQSGKPLIRGFDCINTKLNNNELVSSSYDFFTIYNGKTIIELKIKQCIAF